LPPLPTTTNPPFWNPSPRKSPPTPLSLPCKKNQQWISRPNHSFGNITVWDVTNAAWERAMRLNKRPGKLQMEKRLYPRSLNDFFFSSMYNSVGN
jgi:hypothetical protein